MFPSSRTRSLSVCHSWAKPTFKVTIACLSRERASLCNHAKVLWTTSTDSRVAESTIQHHQWLTTGDSVIRCHSLKTCTKRRNSKWTRIRFSPIYSHALLLSLMSSHSRVWHELWVAFPKLLGKTFLRRDTCLKWQALITRVAAFTRRKAVLGQSLSMNLLWMKRLTICSSTKDSKQVKTS